MKQYWFICYDCGQRKRQPEDESIHVGLCRDCYMARPVSEEV